jgi:Putative adhesin
MAFMRSSLITGSVLAAATLGSACVVSVDSQGQIVREEKRYTVTGTPELRLTTFDGAIEIQAWDKPDVAIDVEKRGATKEAVDGLEVTSSQQGNRIELEVKRPRSESLTGFGFQQSASARLIVSVPHDVNVIARSGDGSIKIERVNGRLELRTGDGSIRASEVSGELILDTGDGSVVVEGARGRLLVDTGDGGVNVAGRLTSVKLHTGDGSIVYRAEPGSEMADDWEITTGDGGVTLYLPPGFGAELDAHTGDGAIRNDLDVSGGPEGEHGENRRTLRGRLGAGGKQIRVRTGDGTIRLRPS